MDAVTLLAEIAHIGRNATTGGYRRFAFTREDAELAEWFTAACESRGLPVVRDRCGNQWAWWGDPDAESDARRGVVTGSHLDSVPDGGAYDGPLGVVSALAAIDVLRARGVTPSRPLGVVRFVDEEGARFGLACSGSRLLTGAARPDGVLGLRDSSGTTYADAMRSAGLDPSSAGRDDEALARVGAFVELHIEQGRALAAPDLAAPVGVATRIRPHGRWRIEMPGRADHAGTTLLADRADPTLHLARLITQTRALAEQAPALATIGKIDIHPNAVNAIPSAVTAWLDARADTPEQVDCVVDGLRASGFAPVRESWTPATEFDPDLSRRIAGAVMRSTGKAPLLATGAGHDAGVLAQAGVPTAMLFVRNPTGASHTPAEFADAVDVETGVLALADVLAVLTQAGAQR